MGLLELFKKPKPPEAAPAAPQTELITDIGGFSPWSGDAYSNDIYRSAVDALARNCGKLKGSHVISYGDKNKVEGDQRLNRLLQVQPNNFMTSYDLLYKMVTHYYLYNNAFAYLQKSDRGQLLGIYPMQPRHIDFLSDNTGEIYCKMLMANGKDYTLPYADIVHLKRHFNDNELLGSPNTAIMGALELAHAQSSGMVASIQTGASIRGVMKYTGILDGEKLKATRQRFMDDFFQMNNNGGVVIVDDKMTYTPINQAPVNIDDAQIKAIKTKIYDYLGISEKIVNSSYDENEWAAAYESVIEPIAVQLSLEFTRKVFNDREMSFGNSIMFESGRLQFSSNATKVSLIKELLPMSILTINDAREILNLPAVDGGEKRLTSLNYVNADKADQYQLNEKETLPE